MYACMSVCMHVFKCKSCNENCITFENAQKGGELDLRTIKKTKREFVFHFFVDSFKKIVFG